MQHQHTPKWTISVLVLVTDSCENAVSVIIISKNWRARVQLAQAENKKLFLLRNQRLSTSEHVLVCFNSENKEKEN